MITQNEGFISIVTVLAIAVIIFGGLWLYLNSANIHSIAPSPAPITHTASTSENSNATTNTNVVPPDTRGYLVIISVNPFVVTDSKGRQAGSTGTTTTETNNIPGATYYLEEGIGNDEDPNGPSLPDVWRFEYIGPPSGDYHVIVFGPEPKTKKAALDVLAYNNVESSFSYSIPLRFLSGNTETFVVKYSLVGKTLVEPINQTSTQNILQTK